MYLFMGSKDSENCFRKNLESSQPSQVYSRLISSLGIHYILKSINDRFLEP